MCPYLLRGSIEVEERLVGMEDYLAQSREHWNKNSVNIKMRKK